MSALHHVTVHSSNVKSVGYDQITQFLEVSFKSGGTYRYAKVPLEIYVGMLHTNSPGKYLQATIKGKYEATKL